MPCTSYEYRSAPSPSLKPLTLAVTTAEKKSSSDLASYDNFLLLALSLALISDGGTYWQWKIRLLFKFTESRKKFVLSFNLLGVKRNSPVTTVFWRRRHGGLSQPVIEILLSRLAVSSSETLEPSSDKLRNKINMSSTLRRLQEFRTPTDMQFVRVFAL